MAGLTRQAKLLNPAQASAVLSFLESTRDPVRNRVIFLLSLKAGLRAKEIAGLKFSMLTDAEGRLTDTIRLENSASKGNSGRFIPMSKDLRIALGELHKRTWKTDRGAFVVTTERSKATSAAAIVNLFSSWYRRLGFEQCSSHSGRRTFISLAARKISLVGGSLRDVQALAGHSALSTTQRYIESNSDAQRKVVDL